MITSTQLPGQNHPLGQLMGTWKVRNTHWLAYFLWAGLLMLFGGGIVVGSLAAFLAAKGTGGTQVCWGGFGLIILGLAVGGGIKAFRERDLQVKVFGEGLLYTKTGRHTTIAWDDIIAVWQDITDYKAYGVVTTHTTRQFTIQLQDGRKFQFNNIFENVATLGQVVQQEVTRHQLPRALQTLKTGTAVSFGKKLSVDAQGLSNGKEIIPWPQVQSVQVNRGVISIKKQGKWLNWSSVTVAETPNVFVFLSLVDTMIGINK